MTKGTTHAKKTHQANDTKAVHTPRSRAKRASATRTVGGSKVKSNSSGRASTGTRSAVSKAPSTRTRQVQAASKPEPEVVEAIDYQGTGPNRVTIKLGTLLGVLGIALLGLYGVIMSILVLARYW